MIRQGALITIATTRSAETLLPLLEGVEIKVPVIMMNGRFGMICKNEAI